jgi:integrase
MPSNAGRKFPAEPLTASEVEALIAACRGNGPIAVRNRALIALLWRSGLRVREALSLRPSDVAGGRINVRQGKARKQRCAVYDGRAAGYLSAWEAVRAGLGCIGHQPLFCSVGSGERRSAGRPIDRRMCGNSCRS